MAYKFVKYKWTDKGYERISQWMFEPQSLEQIHEFTMKYTMPQKREADRRISENIFKAAEREIAGNRAYDSTDPSTVQYRFYNGHPYNSWDKAHYSLYYLEQKLNGGANPLDVNTHMLIQMLNTREKAFNEGILCLYGEEGLSCQAFDDRFCTIIDEIEVDTLIFPNMERPSIDDVRFIMWDTKEQATEAAKQYIKENWK